MLLKSFHIASRQLFYLLIVFIVVGLLGLGVAMWLSEAVAQRKDEIADWASQKIGYPVTIDFASLYWFDLIPKLEISRVTIKQKTADKPIITVGQVFVSLDILQTLTKGEPVLADVSVREVNLKAGRTSQGQIELYGFEPSLQNQARKTLAEMSQWFSWFKQLELSAINIDYEDRQKPNLSGIYQLQQLHWQLAGQQWQVNANIVLPESLGKVVEMTASIEINEVNALKTWQAELLTDDLLLAPLLNGMALQGLTVEEGLFSGTITVMQQDSPGDIKAQLEVMIADAVLNTQKVGKDFEKVTLDQIQGQFTFSRQGESWLLNASDLQTQISGQDWPVTTFSVQHQQDGATDVRVDYFRLGDLTAVALLMEGMPAWLVETKPAGDVFALSARYHRQTGLEALQLRTEELALLAWQDYPGVNDLSFELDWHREQGELKFNSRKTAIYARNWLDEGVYLESLNGKVSWQHQGDNWSVMAEQLNLQNEDFILSLHGRVNHHNDKTNSDLRLELRDVQNNRLSDYIPYALLPDDFGKWFRNAFVGGVIRKGYIELEGDPAAFPFEREPERGRFDMQLKVEDTQLNYAEGWPHLIDVDGIISGQGNNLLIKSESGSIAGFSFREVTATISNLITDNSILRVEGLLAGTTADALSFLQNSPLNKRFATVVQTVEVSGNSDIQLNLMTPLADPDQTEVSGHVTFADSRISLKAEPNLNISQTNGQLNFSNDGLEAKTITAVAFAQAVKIDVVPDSEKTRVELRGNFAITHLRSLWPQQIPDFIDGESDYFAHLLIEEPKQGEFNVVVNVETNLKGVTINAPAPLGKTASQRKSIKLQVDNKEQMIYRLSIENWLDAALVTMGGEPRGQIMLGGEPAKLRDDSLDVSGRFAKLNLDSWLDWQTQWSDSNNKSISIDAVNLYFEELQIYGQTLTNLQLSASQEMEQWKIKLACPQVKGMISLPVTISNNKPLVASLEHLNLAISQTDSSSPMTGSVELWPSMILDIAELEVNDINLGHFSLRSNRELNSWQVESATISSPVLEASLTGSWTQSAQGNRSEFNITASSDNFKDLLAYFNYQQLIEASQLKLSSQVSWPGDPVSFSLASLQGKLSLTVGRGSLIDVEPGAAGRIFGLLSIAAIPRRLALDFSDLFGKGFDFSGINGQFHFVDGIARTDNLTMQGDSALIEVSGPIDMVAKTYDQLVEITPKVSSALPLAGVVAGGPVGLGVGTAIMLFDKIAGRVFDSKIVNLISYSYQLTGPWNNPRLNLSSTDFEED